MIAQHYDEWLASGVAPSIINANVESMDADPEVFDPEIGSPILERLAGESLAAVGRDGQQYATRAVQGILERYSTVIKGGWWVSGIDPLNNWQRSEWGQFKPDQPRLDQDGKPLKYEAPSRTAPRAIFLDTGEPDFWPNAIATLAPLVITEGAKKAGALLSAGFAAVALVGVNAGYRVKDGDGNETDPYLCQDLQATIKPGQLVYLAFDQDSKPSTRRKVGHALAKLGRLLEAHGATVKVVSWPAKAGKGVDDFMAGGGDIHQAIDQAQPLPPAKAEQPTNSSSATILEDQDIEQFRRSLELRQSTLGFDVGLVFPPSLAEAIKNDAVVSNVSANGYVAYMLPLALALLPRTCRIKTPDQTFSEPPVLFSAIIGDSGAGKTRFERACASWFHHQQEQSRARYEADMADYERELEEIQQLEKRRKKDDPPINRPKPKMPRERKFLFNVATPEAVARKLGHQARGSVWMRGELKGLICGIDQYKGKGDGTELILEYWDAGGKSVDRVDEGNSFYASEGNLSIVGGIQGRAFQSAFTDVDDSQGLAARFLFCQVATLPMRRVSGARYLPDILPEIWARINTVQTEAMTLDEAADALYTDLFDQFQDLATAAPYEAVRAWCRKLPGQVLRVAAAVHLIRWGSGAADSPSTIGAEAVLAAWAWLSHCHDSFTLLQDQMRGSTMASLMDAVISLAKGQPGGVSLRDLYAVHLKAQAKKLADPLGKQPADLIREVCLELQANGYGEIKRVGKSDRFIAMEGKP